MSMYPEASSPIGSPYIPAGGNNMGGSDNTPNPNQMGIGGNTGSMSPVAQQMQGMGRGDDSMLIHMTPGEVGGLQALAQAHGGSLTINPHTGLPEAGFLSKLLPTLLGFGLNFFLPGVGSAIGAALGGIGSAAGTAVAVGAGTAAVTGDLKQGLMAGLGAFGGASLGTSALAASAPSVATAGSSVGTALTPGATEAATTALTAGAPVSAGLDALGTGTGAALNAATAGSSVGSTGLSAIAPTAVAAPTGAMMGQEAAALTPAESLATPAAETAAAETAAGTGIDTLAAEPTLLPQSSYLTRLGRGFVDAANNGAKPSFMKTGAAAAGVAIPVMEAFQPAYKEFVPPDDGFNYEGPYRPSKRYLRPDTRNPNSSGERMYFDVTNPMPGFITASGGTPSGYASGGATKTPQLKPADIQAAVELARSQYIPRPDDYVIGGPQEHDYGFKPMATFMPKGAGVLDRGMGQGNTPSSFFGRFYDEEGNFAGLGGRLGGGSANDYYLNPETGRMEPKPPAAAAGMHLKNGSFIVDARTVSELGNGSSRAGQDFLAKFGGHALHGPGDGVSDSIHANIGGTQEARVARDEVKFDPEAVAKLGGGNASAGTKKLYALMAKAEKARKSAKRGQDTGLRAIMGS